MNRRNLLHILLIFHKGTLSIEPDTISEETVIPSPFDLPFLVIIRTPFPAR
jgi:hypothetical protein